MPHVESKKVQRKALRLEEKVTKEEIDEMERIRPRIRADCIDGPRPCPWISCRFHLGIEVKSSGSILINYDGPEGPTGNGFQPTCALDVAEWGGLTLDSVGQMFSVTREYIRQIEGEAFTALKELLGDRR